MKTMQTTPNEESSLQDWLTWQESLHTQEIDLGLDRVSRVFHRLNLNHTCRTITVAGTNGKGSCVAYINGLLHSLDYKTGSFTSPHLSRYNERICIDGTPVSDSALTKAFHRINQARDGIPLTYFEFSALAGLLLFDRRNVDVRILEVGLGGRLDAVNIIDADIAVVSSIDLDHQGWLGDTRELIGFEKAGIFRPDQQAFCGDNKPPQSVIEHAQALKTSLSLIHQDYGFEFKDKQWSFWDAFGRFEGLPPLTVNNQVQYNNAATSIAVVQNLLQRQLPKDTVAGLGGVSVPGRMQQLSGEIPMVLDVAHNPAATFALAQNLAPKSGRLIAVMGLLKDKDIAGIVGPLLPLVREWYLGTIHHHRGSSAEFLAEQLLNLGAQTVQAYDSISEAFLAAREMTRVDDTLLVFGSFHTVGEVMSMGYNGAVTESGINGSRS